MTDSDLFAAWPGIFDYEINTLCYLEGIDKINTAYNLAL